MNCAECQTDPLTPGHYCPCCGRKLSLQEQRAAEGTAPVCAPVLASAIATEPSPAWTPAASRKVEAVETTNEKTVPPPAVNAEEIRLAKAKAVADETAKAHLAKAANPAPVTRRPIVPPPAPVPVPAQSRSRTPMLMIAAVVIVGAIGAVEGARRFGFDWPGRAVHEAAPAQATAPVESVAPVARGAVPPATPSAPNVAVATKAVAETKVVAVNHTSAIPPSRAAAKPKVSTPVARRAPARQGNPSAQQVVPVAARTPAPETPAPAPTKPAPSRRPRNGESQ